MAGKQVKILEQEIVVCFVALSRETTKTWALMNDNPTENRIRYLAQRDSTNWYELGR
jgi:hypothetical protein